MMVPHVGLVLEQTLGHITHADNLRSLIQADPRVEAEFAPVEFALANWQARIPGFGNWTVRAGVRSRLAIRRLRRERPLDALFIHTQVPAILVPDQLRRTPTVVSLDATPIQYDELGDHYEHATSGPRAERLKWRANRNCFAKAAAIVTWAEWTKTGLIERYEVPADKIVVIPPGVHRERWTADATDRRRTAEDAGPVRTLFVGGDLARKGGLVLLEAVRRLRHDGVDVQLDLVTRDEVESEPGVTVHHGLGPNSPSLINLYHRADVFCLPTLGDCLPMVLSEAGAVGLPLVSTDVGAIGEIVRDGQTGLLVPAGDAGALASALGRLAADADLRRRLGDEASRVVAADFDAARNAGRLVELLVEVSERSRHPPVLLTVSGVIPPTVDEDIVGGHRPRADYLEVAEACDAELIDHAASAQLGGLAAAGVERLAGANARLAVTCFWQRRDHEVVLTDGEQVGMPYAASTWLSRRRPRHIMIGHVLSPRKKLWLHRALQLQRRIDTVVVYSSAQRQVAIERLGYRPEQVVLMPFMVDTEFFHPEHTSSPHGRKMICAVGQELRDYPTLIEAAGDLDLDVVIAAASPWSKRADTSEGLDLPSNVTARGFSQFELRQLYADAAFVVLPLQDNDFQAGITTILEAMAMGRALICTATTGQTDTIIDAVNGIYVPPADPRAMRAAIERLVADPAEAARLGSAGRRWVLDHARIEDYADAMAAVVRRVVVDQRST